jgi:hypothetical protein
MTKLASRRLHTQRRQYAEEIKNRFVRAFPLDFVHVFIKRALFSRRMVSKQLPKEGF